ncbi:MAG: HEPN domain-containing protein [Haliscomenobacteraceae bacterium CHB4]|nr:HEPN domain-containing protein [Haliscomenobacteraceae bacterium CHB4]
MTYEIARMLYSAEECLSSATYNFQGGWHKAAVNRCYYCLFDCITALLFVEGVSAKTHQGAHVKFR